MIELTRLEAEVIKTTLQSIIELVDEGVVDDVILSYEEIVDSLKIIESCIDYKDNREVCHIDDTSSNP